MGLGMHTPILAAVPPSLPATVLLGAMGLGVAGLAWSVFSPSSQVFGPVVRFLAAPDEVALTFDDGPTARFTSRVLDILAERRAKASFFVIGQWVRQHPELARRIVDEGHLIGNHTWDHHHFGVVEGLDYWRRQIARTNAAIHDVTGIVPQLFRPPMGFKTWHVAAAARGAAMRIIGWSIRGRDTGRIQAGPLAQRVTRQLRGGMIVALHDGLEPARLGKSQAATVAALPAILDGIAARGFRCVSLQALQVAAPPTHAGGTEP
jgi:peptidoglycan-N-acetylglucosamine deacetylase